MCADNTTERPIRLRLDIPAQLHGQPLDRVLALAARVSPARAAQAIAFGAVRVNGAVVTAGNTRMTDGALLSVDYDPSMDQNWTPEILYEDAVFVLVNKPAGVPVQGTRAGTGNSLEEMLRRLAQGKWSPHVVHRLDLPVSGLLLVARSQPAARKLHALFESLEVHKTYLAVVRTGPALPQIPCVVDAPLKWLPSKQKALVAPDGRPSKSILTACEPLGDGKAVVALDLITGRTHQARAHLAHLGLPIAGDTRYGHSQQRRPRIALHAARLRLQHPETGTEFLRTVLPPDDFWQASGLTPMPSLAEQLLGRCPRLGP